MRIAIFLIRGFESEGELVKSNAKTVLVRLRRAGKTRIIKRHRRKHHVHEEV